MTNYMREGMAEFEGCPSAPGCVQGLGAYVAGTQQYTVIRPTHLWAKEPGGAPARPDVPVAVGVRVEGNIPVGSPFVVVYRLGHANMTGRPFVFLIPRRDLIAGGAPRLGRSVLGLGAIPTLDSLGLGLNLKTAAIVAALAVGACLIHKQMKRKHNRRRSRKRNSPYRVKAIYMSRPAAEKAYRALPSGEMYKSFVDRNPRDARSHRRGSGKFDTRAVLDKTQGLPMHAF